MRYDRMDAAGMDKRENHTTAVIDPDGSVTANIDFGRSERCGAPEAVFAAGKTVDDALAVTAAMIEGQGFALVTKAGAETMASLRSRWPEGRFSRRGGTALIGTPPPGRTRGSVAVVAAGTSDLAVAEEAAFTLDAVGAARNIVADVGVAGIYRLFNRLEELRRAEVILAVAGMEGALPSVLSGLVAAPVIAVPTSVGYGASFSGLSALLGMLNTCSPGIAVVNIDNGFGAAVMAARILRIVSAQ